MTNSNQDLRERCSYLLILFKAKDKALFEKYSAQLAQTSAEESEKFYHWLLAEYKKLNEGTPVSQTQAQPKPQVQKPAAPVAPPKKAVAKKPTKKVAKKAPVKKKAVKKVTKKVTKKVAKKVTKKPKRKK